jgi:RPA family protein
MKKIFSLFAAVLFAGSMMAADVLSIDFTAGQGSWTINDVELDGISYVWQQSSSYGMKASAYVSGANHATESWLISPAINLSGATEATLAISHVRRYGDVSHLSVKATADGENWSALTVSAWSDGSNWTFIDATADLSDFAGEESVKIAFVYTSTSSAAGTWEIKTAKVTADVEEGQGGGGEEFTDPTNCAEAREAALSVSANNELYNDGKEYTIQGFVTSIAYAWKDGSMSFWMADTKEGGNVLEAYKCAIENEEDAVRVGDKVAVTGKLTKFNTTPEFAAGCTVEILERAAAPVNLGEKTIEEFLALKNTKDTCVLTGVVKNIVNTTYGNFDLEDETGTVYVYGLLTAAGESKKFEEMGIEENDILTVKAIYDEFNGNPQAKNAVFVSVEKGEKPEPQTIELDVVYGEAALYATQGIWQINLYKDYDSETQTVTYPDLYIGVTPKSATTIAGIYSIEEEIAFVEVDVASEQTVTATEATDLEVVCLGDGVYSFYMEFVGDDGNTYVLDAEVPVLAYNGESEEGEEIELKDNPETGVESTKVADKAVKFIENATLLIERNGVRYNVMGQVVR